MEDKILMEFAAWLPESGVKEFAEKSPEECIMLLDKVVSSGEEGEKMVRSLFTKFQNAKNKQSNLNSKAAYLNTLKAQNGSKVKRVPGEPVGQIRHDNHWNLVKDYESGNNRIQVIENNYGDRIKLTTGQAGDSTLQALPVKYYEGVRKEAGYNPYVLDYETPEHRNAAAWTTRDGLTKFLDAIFFNKFDLEDWKDASDKYSPYFKNPSKK